MRICLVTETYVPEINGVAKTLERLVNELDSRGHHIHIVRPHQKNEVNITKHVHTRVTGLPLPGYRGLQFGLPAANKLKVSWTKNRPDIVYVATEGPLGWSAVKVANKLNIPVISGFHTNFHSYSQHYKLGWLKKIIFSYLKNLHNKTLCTLAPSPEVIDYLKSRGINSSELFSRGVDTEIYSPVHRSEELRENLGIDKNAPVALYVGRLAPEKNIDLIIRAYQEMKQLAPELRLLIVGDGPLLNQLKVQHQDIIFAGMQVCNSLSEYYASADVFLFASETETFGNVVLEAMASGLVVIAYDYAAVKMHINNKVNGIAVEPGNPDAFCHLAARLIRHPEDVNSMRRMSRIKAEQIDWKNVIDNFEKVLVKYVKSGSIGRRESDEVVSVDGSA